MSKAIKPIAAVYEDDEGQRYLKIDGRKEVKSDDDIDLEHTDNESDGESEEYLDTSDDGDESEEEETPKESEPSRQLRSSK